MLGLDDGGLGGADHVAVFMQGRYAVIGGAVGGQDHLWVVHEGRGCYVGLGRVGGARGAGGRCCGGHGPWGSVF